VKQVCNHVIIPNVVGCHCLPKPFVFASEAKRGIEMIGTPGYCGRTIFPDDGIAEAIRPAGDNLNAARRVREAGYKNVAKVRKERDSNIRKRDGSERLRFVHQGLDPDGLRQ
jgi:hypothetical protein